MNEETQDRAGSKPLPQRPPTRSKLPLVFVLCAFAVPILTAVLNPKIETQTYDSGGVTVYEGSIRVTANEIQPTSGDFAWRYFKWGIYKGEHTPQEFHRSLEGIFGWQLSKDISEFLNVANPTPFLITVGFLAIAWIVKLVTGRKRRVPATAAS